jgi:hypothetical protein
MARNAASMGGLVRPAAAARAAIWPARRWPLPSASTASAAANAAASPGSTRRWPIRSSARPASGAESAVPAPNAPAAKPAVAYEPVTDRTKTTMAVAAMASGMRPISAGVTQPRGSRPPQDGKIPRGHQWSRPRRVIHRASCPAHAQRLIAQPAQPVRAGAVCRNSGQQPPRQPLKGGSLIGIQPADQLLDRCPPPAQDPPGGQAPRFGQVQGQCPSRSRPGAADQPVRLQAIGQPHRTRVRQAQRPAQAAHRLAGVMGQRHQRRGVPNWPARQRAAALPPGSGPTRPGQPPQAG